MKISQLAGPLPLALLLAACSDDQATAPEQRETSAGTAAPSAAADGYSAAGDVTKVAGDQVTISHGPVESLGWPAMTMTFQAPSPAMLQGLNTGDPVDFQFRKAGEQYQLTSIEKAQQ